MSHWIRTLSPPQYPFSTSVCTSTVRTILGHNRVTLTISSTVRHNFGTSTYHLRQTAGITQTSQCKTPCRSLWVCSNETGLSNAISVSANIKYVCKEWAKIHPVLALRPSMSLVLNLCLSYASDEAQDSPYGGVIVVAWFHEIVVHVTKS
jgi:hypothetical protein